MNETIGYGVFATQLIPKGTITWVRDRLDQAFTPDQMKAMGEPYMSILDKFTFVDSQGVAVLCWDLARFVNHSCNANCLSAGYDFELAVRDILPGEELTDDYGTLNLIEQFSCACAHDLCRGAIRPDDLTRLSPVFDTLVRDAFPLLPQVEQPLWNLIRERQVVEMALKDLSQLRSCLNHYYEGVKDSVNKANRKEHSASMNEGVSTQS